MFKAELRKLRVQKNLTQEELAQKMELSKSAISMYENGNRVPTLALLKKFAEFFEVDLDSLAGTPAAKNIIPLPKTKKIPLLGSIACGTPILAQENIDDMISMPDGLNADFALYCKGDSMTGARIYDGDIVYIRQQPDVENGEIAAVLIDDEATLKRVYKYPSKIVLNAENPSFEPLVFTGSELEQLRILGKAVAFLSGVR
ncbi:MAG: helix-turn-helix domain-containing protein [Oscillospiraceae bacterium]|nr:helix-turn-helix domain-containing protein [Oscillospiraceae bacterium]